VTTNLTLSSDWLAHRYDERQDAIQFVAADRAQRASTPFLTDVNLPGATAPVAVPRGEAMTAAPPPAPLHFIFHSAYCCSTLLAAALDLPGLSTSYKEPQLLNDMVGWRLRGAQPQALTAVLGDALTLLARPFEPGEACVVKPSNVVNGLIGPMLGMRLQARAIFLHAPLRSFITSIARKGMDGRLWVRELLSRQLTEGWVDLGFAPRDYLLHTDLQAAAVGWLAQQRLFAEIARRNPDRVRTLDSETLVRQPDRVLAATAKLFGLALDDDKLRTAIDAHFTRNAKDGSRFEPGQRDADRQAGEALHADEIEKVTIWAEAVAAQANVPLTLPLPLLD
jgi:hypothetical protein